MRIWGPYPLLPAVLGCLAVLAMVAPACSSNSGTTVHKPPTRGKLQAFQRKKFQASKLRDPLVRALRDRNLAYLAGVFAPRVYFQHVVVYRHFEAVDFRFLPKKQGALYHLLFDSAFVRKRISPRAASFAEAILAANHTTIHQSPGDRQLISSVTAFYKDYVYDITLNCNRERVCEIAGLGMTPARGIGTLWVSSHPSTPGRYQRLTKRHMLASARKWYARGMQVLTYRGKELKTVFGPNHPFTIHYAGDDPGAGGVAYLVVKNRGYILFRHLSLLHRRVLAASKSGATLPAATFLGGNRRKMGIHRKDEGRKVTAMGRNEFGLLRTEGATLAILRGR